MTWEEVQRYYQKHPELQGPYFDAAPVISVSYPETEWIYTKDYYIDFSTIHGTKAEMEMKLALLYLILNRKLLLQTIIVYYIEVYPCMIDFLAHGLSQPVREFSFVKVLKGFDSDIRKYFAQDHKFTMSRIKYASLLPRKLKNLLERMAYTSEEDYFQRDSWSIYDFHMEKDRINPTNSMYRFYFYDIYNENNRYILKKMVDWMIKKSHISFSTMYTRYSHIKEFLKHFQTRRIQSLTTEDLTAYMAELSNISRQITTYNVKICSLEFFYKLGKKLGFWNTIPLNFHAYRKRYSYVCDYHTIGGVSDYVKRQLFSKMKEMPRDLAMILLIMYETGMRISEVCRLTLDSLQDFHGRYYLVYWQLKMKKEVEQPIPYGLYLRMKDYKEEILTEYPGEIYFFTSGFCTPAKTLAVSVRMNKFISLAGIMEKDGTPYHFKAHEFRHDFALRLVNNKIPFLEIQKLLHHSSPEMSMIYAKVSEQERKKRYNRFCDSTGHISLKLNEKEMAVHDDVAWMHYMLGQILPNGYCSYPARLGVCPHANRCLFCDQFKTTVEFLPVLKRQLLKVNCLMDRAGHGENEEYRKTLEKVHQKLQLIISSLEASV